MKTKLALFLLALLVVSCTSSRPVVRTTSKPKVTTKKQPVSQTKTKTTTAKKPVVTTSLPASNDNESIDNKASCICNVAVRP